MRSCLFVVVLGIPVFLSFTACTRSKKLPAVSCSAPKVLISNLDRVNTSNNQIGYGIAQATYDLKINETFKNSSQWAKRNNGSKDFGETQKIHCPVYFLPTDKENEIQLWGSWHCLDPIFASELEIQSSNLEIFKNDQTTQAVLGEKLVPFDISGDGIWSSWRTFQQDFLRPILQASESSGELLQFKYRYDLVVSDFRNLQRSSQHQTQIEKQMDSFKLANTLDANPEKISSQYGDDEVFDEHIAWGEEICSTTHGFQSTNLQKVCFLYTDMLAIRLRLDSDSITKNFTSVDRLSEDTLKWQDLMNRLTLARFRATILGYVLGMAQVEQYNLDRSATTSLNPGDLLDRLENSPRILELGGLSSSDISEIRREVRNIPLLSPEQYDLLLQVWLPANRLRQEITEAWEIIKKRSISSPDSLSLMGFFEKEGGNKRSVFGSVNMEELFSDDYALLIPRRNGMVLFHTDQDNVHIKQGDSGTLLWLNGEIPIAAVASVNNEDVSGGLCETALPESIEITREFVDTELPGTLGRQDADTLQDRNQTLEEQRRSDIDASNSSLKSRTGLNQKSLGNSGSPSSDSSLSSSSEPAPACS